MKHRFEINIDEYKVVHDIQSGTFGTVYLAKNINTGKEVAAKVIKQTMSHSKDDEKYKQKINREIVILIRCQHPTIIKFIGFSFRDFLSNNITIFMEYMKNGSLASILEKSRKSPNRFLDNTAKQIILIGIARGMLYLHKHRVIHRDLKPGNILLDENLFPHITDFGLSKIFVNAKNASQSYQMGTIAYMAPEIPKGDECGSKIDVYAFGILMYEVITNRTAYPDIEKIPQYIFNKKIIEEDYRPTFKEDDQIKEPLKNLIKKCWDKNPKDRPTFEEIFKKLAYNMEDNIDSIDTGDQYYLQDVDIEKVLSYSYEIEQDDIQMQIEVENLSKNVEEIMSENMQLKKETNIQKNEVEQLKTENINLKKEIKNIKENLLKYEKRMKNWHNTNANDTDNNDSNDNDNYNEEYIGVDDDGDEDDYKPEFDVHKITIDEFNKASLKTQQSIIFNLMLEGTKYKMNKYLQDINAILDYLSTFVKNDAKKLFELNTEDNSSILCENNRSFQIMLLAKATEMLFDKDELHETTFANLISKLDNISIQLNYPSNKFKASYNIVKNLQKTKNQNISISVYINGIKETDYEFQKDENIHSIYFGPSVLTIKGDENGGSFYNCTSLKEVVLSNNVSTIGENSFYGCSSLWKISIPSSVISIGKNAFFGCSSIKDMVIPCSLTEINEQTFAKCFSLQKIVIPTSISTLKSQSFLNCQNLDNISITSVNDIENATFSGCSSLHKIEFSSSLKKISESLFFNCVNLSQIKIPDSVLEIQKNAFKGCTNIKNIDISSALKIEIGAFNGCTSLCEIKLSSSLKTIESYTFNGCTSLKSFSIPLSVISIESYAFSKCSSLKAITIPNNVTKISDDAFSGCKLLKEIKISSSVKAIGMNCFKGCSSLINIEIPSSISIIDENAFNECTNLSYIIIDPYKTKINGYPFKGCTQLLKLILGRTCSSVNDINKFQLVQKVYNVVIPPSVLSIDANSFAGCSLLQDVTLPDTLNSIEDNAFNGCKSLKQIIFPRSIISIGKCAFKDC